MNFIKKNWHKLVFMSSYALVLPLSKIYAQGYNPSSGNCPDGSPMSAGKICNPLGASSTSIPALIQQLLKGAITLGIPVVALAIVYSGFLFVAARGNSEKLTKAKDSLLWTIVGAAVLLGAWAIAQMIQATVTGLSS
ncbi:MAG: pilin [Candidatus Pacebacteria bacterium]|nr:pilin [Candidatus Paceibacterota bacterium]